MACVGYKRLPQASLGKFATFYLYIVVRIFIYQNKEEERKTQYPTFSNTASKCRRHLLSGQHRPQLSLSAGIIISQPPAVPEAQRRKVRNQGQHQTGNDTGSLTTEVSGSRLISSRNDTLLRLHRLVHVKLWTALYVPAIGKIGIFAGMHRVQESFSAKLPIKKWYNFNHIMGALS